MVSTTLYVYIFFAVFAYLKVAYAAPEDVSLSLILKTDYDNILDLNEPRPLTNVFKYKTLVLETKVNVGDTMDRAEVSTIKHLLDINLLDERFILPFIISHDYYDEQVDSLLNLFADENEDNTSETNEVKVKEQYIFFYRYSKFEKYMKKDLTFEERKKMLNKLGNLIHNLSVNYGFVIKDPDSCILVNESTGELETVFGVHCISIQEKESMSAHLVRSVMYFIKVSLFYSSAIPQPILDNYKLVGDYGNLPFLEWYDLEIQEPEPRIILLFNSLIILNKSLDNRSYKSTDYEVLLVRKLTSLFFRSNYIVNNLKDFYELEKGSHNRFDILAQDTVDIPEPFTNAEELIAIGIPTPDLRVNIRLNQKDFVIHVNETYCKRDCIVNFEIEKINSVVSKSNHFLTPILSAKDRFSKNVYLTLPVNAELENYEIYREVGFNLLSRSFNSYITIHGPANALTKLINIVEALAELEIKNVELTPLYAMDLKHADFVVVPVITNNNYPNNMLSFILKIIFMSKTNPDFNINTVFAERIYQFTPEHIKIFEALEACEYVLALKYLKDIDIENLSLVSKFPELTYSKQRLPISIFFDYSERTSATKEKIETLKKIYNITEIHLMPDFSISASTSNVYSLDNFDKFIDIVVELTKFGWIIAPNDLVKTVNNPILAEYDYIKNSDILNEFLIYAGFDIDEEYPDIESINVSVLNCILSKMVSNRSLEVFIAYSENFIPSTLEGIKHLLNSIKHVPDLSLSFTENNDSEKYLLEFMRIALLSNQISDRILNEVEDYSILKHKVQNLFFTEPKEFFNELKDIVTNYNYFSTSYDRVDEFMERKLILNQDCNICLFPLNEVENAGPEVSVHSCRSAYHKDCIEKWIYENPNCPLCRQEDF